MPALSQTTRDRVASLAASYAKRLLDTHAYDQLFAGEVGQRLRGLPDIEKRLAEFALHASAVVIDEQLKGEGSLDKFLKEVLSDAPSEVAARLNTKPSTADGSRDFIERASELSTAETEELVSWLSTASDEERGRLRNELTKRSAETLKAILALSPDTRARLMAIADPAATPSQSHRPERSEHRPGFLESLAQSIEGAANKLKEEREKRS